MDWRHLRANSFNVKGTPQQGILPINQNRHFYAADNSHNLSMYFTHKSYKNSKILLFILTRVLGGIWPIFFKSYYYYYRYHVYNSLTQHFAGGGGAAPVLFLSVFSYKEGLLKNFLNKHYWLKFVCNCITLKRKYTQYFRPLINSLK